MRSSQALALACSIHVLRCFWAIATQQAQHAQLHIYVHQALCHHRHGGGGCACSGPRGVAAGHL